MKEKVLSWAMMAVMATPSAWGEVVATARSPEGAFPEFRVVLDAVGQPTATANFMGLADGSREWVDPETGAVRGGDGDAFYAGMAFTNRTEEMVRGGLRRRELEDGTVEYQGGPGYTVLGKTNEALTAFGWGALALAEDGGPHSGGGEIAFLLTNSTAGWTVFGQVKAGDEAGLAALAARVEAGTATEVTWSVDADGATPEERAALEAARGLFPAIVGIETQAKGDGTVEFEWPSRSQLGIMTSTNLLQGMQYVAGGWNDGPEGMRWTASWADAGLTGAAGFLAFEGVRYPGMTMALEGKWRMGMDHSGQRIQYWFDFGGKTGLWAVVEGGEITDSGTLSGIRTGRAAGNSLGIFFTAGMTANYYYLGFGEAEAKAGRFMSRQMVGNWSTDWGMFEMEAGWGGDKEPGIKRREPRGKSPKTKRGRGRWVEWKQVGDGDWERAVKGIGQRGRTW